MRTITIKIPNDLDLQQLLWLFRRMGLKIVSKGDFKEEAPITLAEIPSKEPTENKAVAAQNLNFVQLANEMFQGTEPLPIEAQEALEEAFISSLKKKPTLPNRL